MLCCLWSVGEWMVDDDDDTMQFAGFLYQDVSYSNEPTKLLLLDSHSTSRCWCCIRPSAQETRTWSGEECSGWGMGLGCQSWKPWFGLKRESQTAPPGPPQSDHFSPTDSVRSTHTNSALTYTYMQKLGGKRNPRPALPVLFWLFPPGMRADGQTHTRTHEPYSYLDGGLHAAEQSSTATLPSYLF